jgi:hypothetical protein
MKGEATITLGDGSEVHIKYNNFALAQAEEMLGRPIMAVAQHFDSGGIGVADVGKILLAGMRGGGERRASMRQAFEIMDDVGLIPVATATITAALEVLTHNSEEGDDDPN